MSAPVDYTNSYTYPAEKDGWFRAHHTLRKDMDDVLRMVNAYSNQVSQGVALTPAQCKAAKDHWEVFYHFLHHHHDNEEKVAFPFLAKKAEIPSRMSEDHVTLIAALESCKKLLYSALDATETGAAYKSLSTLHAEFTALKVTMLEHFAEEESILMPMMRKHVSEADYIKHVVTPIVRSLTASDNGDFFHKFDSEEDIKGFYRQEKIPFFICWLLNFFRRKYIRTVYTPFIQQVEAAEAYRPPALAA